VVHVFLNAGSVEGEVGLDAQTMNLIIVIPVVAYAAEPAVTLPVSSGVIAAERCR